MEDPTKAPNEYPYVLHSRAADICRKCYPKLEWNTAMSLYLILKVMSEMSYYTLKELVDWEMGSHYKDSVVKELKRIYNYNK